MISIQFVVKFLAQSHYSFNSSSHQHMCSVCQIGVDFSLDCSVQKIVQSKTLKPKALEAVNFLFFFKFRLLP